MVDSDPVDVDALIHGFRVDAKGRAFELDWKTLQGLDIDAPGQWCWIHLNRRSAATAHWLRSVAEVDNLVLAALLQDDTRPRIVSHEHGYLLNLRGVNLNPGADPEDMISLRLWATGRFVISTRATRILAAEDVRDMLRGGHPVHSSGALIAAISRQLVTRMSSVIAELDDKVDELEEQLLQTTASSSRTSISVFRRMVLTLRRYMAPQREALAGFLRESEDFLVGEDRHSLRDTQDVLVRLLEDLDMIRERALLLQEQLVEDRAEAMNDRLFVLSVISAVFLPLGFFTGLFGVNVGGMPGINSPIAFSLLCVGMLGFAILVVWLFKRLKWI